MIFSNFELGNTFENFDQKKVKNIIFCQKITFLLPKLKMWKKKPFLEKCLNMIFKQF